MSCKLLNLLNVIFGDDRFYTTIESDVSLLHFLEDNLFTSSSKTIVCILFVCILCLISRKEVTLIVYCFHSERSVTNKYLLSRGGSGIQFKRETTIVKVLRVPVTSYKNTRMVNKWNYVLRLMTVSTKNNLYHSRGRRLSHLYIN